MPNNSVPPQSTVGGPIPPPPPPMPSNSISPPQLPPTVSGPFPPPPPPPGGLQSLPKQFHRSTDQPDRGLERGRSRKTLKLHWRPVPLAMTKEPTVWDSLPNVKIDSESLLSMFEVQDGRRRKKSSCTSNSSKGPKS